MIRHTTKIPWWFPDGKALAYLMGGACLAVALLTVSRFIQGFPYAVVVLGASFGAAVYWLVRLLKRHSNVLLSEASADFLQEWGAYLVAWAILLPLAVSWLENETFRAAWSPVDYWRDEAREAAEQNCDVEREWMNRSAEEVQIAIRKRSLGIATNGEVMDELTGYESFRDIHHSCIANLAARRHRANAMLKRLGDM